MRVAGILLLALLPVLFGIGKYMTLKQHVRTLAQLKLYILFVREKIRFGSGEITQILQQAAAGQPFRHCEFAAVLAGFDRFAEQDTPENQLGACAGLSRSDAAALAGFYVGLGVNDIPGQMQHCDYYLAQLENAQKQADEALALKGRLYISLSASVAAAVFILLI